MSNNNIKDIASSRVNICVKTHQNHDEEKKELSFKLLIIGDFSAKTSLSPLHDRKKLNVTKKNLEAIFNQVSPKLSFSCKDHLNPDKEKLQFDLAFNSLFDFSPDGLCQKVPEFKRIIAMRNLLKDLKYMLQENKNNAQRLSRILSNKVEKNRLATTLANL